MGLSRLCQPSCHGNPGSVHLTLLPPARPRDPPSLAWIPAQPRPLYGLPTGASPCWWLSLEPPPHTRREWAALGQCPASPLRPTLRWLLLRGPPQGQAEATPTRRLGCPQLPACWSPGSSPGSTGPTHILMSPQPPGQWLQSVQPSLCGALPTEGHLVAWVTAPSVRASQGRF